MKNHSRDLEYRAFLRTQSAADHEIEYSARD